MDEAIHGCGKLRAFPRTCSVNLLSPNSHKLYCLRKVAIGGEKISCVIIVVDCRRHHIDSEAHINGFFNPELGTLMLFHEGHKLRKDLRIDLHTQAVNVFKDFFRSFVVFGARFDAAQMDGDSRVGLHQRIKESAGVGIYLRPLPDIDSTDVKTRADPIPRTNQLFADFLVVERKGTPNTSRFEMVIPVVSVDKNYRTVGQLPPTNKNPGVWLSPDTGGVTCDIP